MEIISVIVPVYNVRKYLKICLDSIINQTYPHLEILLIDDGSTDGSNEICQRYQESDQRIRYVRQKNQGLSGARNTGLRLMTGEWVCFVDSDDWLDRRYIEVLLEEAQRNQLDVVACSFFLSTEADNKAVNLLPYCSENREQILADYFLKETLRTVVWNKLYRSTLLNGLTFEVEKLHEDDFFTYRLLSRAKKVEQLAEPLYYYRQRTDSIMGTRMSIKNLDSLEAQLGKIEYVRQNLPDISPEFLMKSVHLALYLYQKTLVVSEREERREIQWMISTYVDKFAISDSEKRCTSSKDRISLFLVTHMPKQYAKVRNLLKRGI